MTETTDAARDLRTMRLFAEARAQRLRKIEAGEHVCPPWPEECDRAECQEQVNDAQ